MSDGTETAPTDGLSTEGATAPSDSTFGKAPFLSDYLLFLLAAASASASAGFHAIAREHGLRVPEWRVLACLHDRDGQMVTRLAALALMEQSAMTRVVERMEERGLVTRQSDARDRRRVRVFLAPAGRALLVPLLKRAREQEAQVLACLPPPQRQALKPMLASLLDALPDNPLARGGEEHAGRG